MDRVDWDIDELYTQDDGNNYGTRGSQPIFAAFQIARKPDHALNNIIIPIYLLGILASLTFAYKATGFTILYSIV